MKNRFAVLAAGMVAIVVFAGNAYFYLSRSRPPAPASAVLYTPITQQSLSHGRFENFPLFVPHGTPRGFVLLLSGNDGWTPDMDTLARQIAADGALVAGLDTARFNASLDTDGGQCVYPDGDLENMSHFVQAYAKLPTYLSPILAGHSAGATLAYASLVQAPKGTFAGAVSLDFCPAYTLAKPLCKGSGIEFVAHPDGKGFDFLPTKDAVAWTVVQPHDGSACPIESVRAFTTQVPGAQFITPPPTDASTATVKAIDTLMQQHPAVAASTLPSELSDLPLVILPAAATAATQTAAPTTVSTAPHAAIPASADGTAGTADGNAPGNTFAIILSGDGGWAGLDKDVAGALTAVGIPVVGLDSLRYFWSERTPEGLAHDLDRITRYYLAQLRKEHVILIGYSQGADVLPFAVNRLSAATRSHATLAALMGMSEHALFEFHVTNWISDDNSGPATLPEVDKITGMPVLCIYGEEETDTLCPKLDPHKAIVVKLKGGHHFDGDYPALARIILKAAGSL